MAEHVVSLTAATSSRCSRCGILVTYGCLAARLCYRVCYKCGREMLPPGEWLGYLPPIPEREKVHVLYGYYGHLTDPTKRMDVSAALQRRVDGASGRRLTIGINETLSELFGGDPCPGTKKGVFITVDICGREHFSQHAEDNGLLMEPIRIVADEWKGGLDGSEEAKRITVLCAVVGEPHLPTTAVDITRVVQRRVDDSGGKVLLYDRTENLGYSMPDPAPGSDKLLVVRYQTWGRIGELRVEGFATEEGFRLKRTLYLEVVAVRPRFLLHGASFGHPTLASVRYDVTERMQGRMDETGAGEFVGFTAEQDLCEWLGGDPHPGAEKHLIVWYEFLGQSREVLTQERHGRLINPITVVAPITMPAITVRTGFFRHANGKDVYDISDMFRYLCDAGGAGWEIKLGVEDDVMAMLGFDIDGVPLPARRGMPSPIRVVQLGSSDSLSTVSPTRPMTGASTRTLRAKGAEAAAFPTLPTMSPMGKGMLTGGLDAPSTLSTTSTTSLLLPTLPLVPTNKYFGNPKNPRRRDAMAKYGWGAADKPKDGVLPAPLRPADMKAPTVACHLVDLFYNERGAKGEKHISIPVGSCHPTSELHVDVGTSDPHIHVLSATYGHPFDARKVIDLKDKMLQKIKRTREGFRLDVTTTEDLDGIFGVPVESVYKVLYVRYRVLAERGRHIVILRRNGPLGSAVRIGFAPLGEVLERGGRV